jgi:hypothetical protein
MLLGLCLLYGFIIAKIFGKDNFNTMWIWSTFIIFYINNECLNGKLNLFIHKDEHEE